MFCSIWALQTHLPSTVHATTRHFPSRGQPCLPPCYNMPLAQTSTAEGTMVMGHHQGHHNDASFYARSFLRWLASRSTMASVCVSVMTSELRIALQITIVCADDPFCTQQIFNGNEKSNKNRSTSRFRGAGNLRVVFSRF